MDRGIAASTIPTRHRAVARARRAMGRFALSAVCPAFIGSSAAAQGKGLQVELNKLDDVGNGCRAYLVFENATDRLFSGFKMDLVLFDIQGIGCADTGRILINDVIECRDGEAEFQNCVALVIPSSRTDAEFIK